MGGTPTFGDLAPAGVLPAELPAFVPQVDGSAALQDEQDVELLSKIASGDRSALAALYQRHGRVTFAQIYLLVGDRGMSEEILQDTMLAVWHGAGSFRGQSRVRSWIISIARRRARDRLRRHQTRVVGEGVLADLSAEEPGPEDVALASARAALTRTLSETSSHLTMDELIAHVNGASGTAASRAHLAGCATCQAEARE